jgi:hypothetical protein
MSGALLRQAVMVCFIVAWIGSVFALFPAPASPEYPAWPDGLLVGWAAVSAVLSLSRHLPAQNIVAVVGVVLIVTGGTFGNFALQSGAGASLIYGHQLGPAFAGRLPWILFPASLVMILTARGVALLMVRPRLGRGGYGIWLIGVTTLLVVSLAAGVELLAVQVKYYWRWENTGEPWNWNGLLWPALALWLITALAVQVLGLPWLVSKRPGVPEPDWHPLILWFLVNLWIVAGTSTRGWLQPAALTLGATAVTTALAVWGGMARVPAGSRLTTATL